jgi:hypothetical protein
MQVSCRLLRRTRTMRPDFLKVKVPARRRPTGWTHLLASALRRCPRIARSRRLRKEQGGFAAAANPKDMFFEYIEIKREEIQMRLPCAARMFRFTSRKRRCTTRDGRRSGVAEIAARVRVSEKIMPYCYVFFCPLLAFSLFLSACSLRPVRVLQEPLFKTMCGRLGPEMIRRSLLDADGQYLANHLPVFKKRDDYGTMLFRRLSPSFRYRPDAPAALMKAPESFAESVSSPRDARIREYGFSLTQGTDAVDVDMIALADWDGTGKEDWLLSCRVDFGGAPVSRVYYLVVAAPGEEGALVARTIAVHECAAFDCAVYPGDGYIPEAPVIEVAPGRSAVTSPPSSRPPVRPAARFPAEAPKKGRR